MIRTERLELVPWDDAHVDAVVRIADSYRVWLNLRDSFPHPYTADDARGWVAFNRELEGPEQNFALLREQPRTTVTRCGSCTKNCNTAILNANSITCNTGTCAYAACKPGFASCDGNAANGCECACGKLDQPCCPGDVCEAPLRCLGGGMGNKSCR
jgi:hypothetical protein